MSEPRCAQQAPEQYSRKLDYRRAERQEPRREIELVSSPNCDYPRGLVRSKEDVEARSVGLAFASPTTDKRLKDMGLTKCQGLRRVGIWSRRDTFADNERVIQGAINAAPKRSVLYAPAIFPLRFCFALTDRLQQCAFPVKSCPFARWRSVFCIPR
jgi:hypothetical protein